MTDEEKKQLVDAVITQLKNEGTDVSNASIVENADGVAYIICYDANGNIARVTTTTLLEDVLGDEELLKRIQGTSENSDAAKDPFKFLGEFESFEELIKGLDTLHNVEGITGSSVHNGHFRALVNEKLVDIINEVQGYVTDVWSQRITCAGIVLRNDVVNTETSYSDYSNNEGHKYRQHRYVQKFVDAVNGGVNFDKKGGVKTFCRRHYLAGGASTWTPWYDVENPYVQTQNYGKKIALFGGSFAQNMAVSSSDYKFTHEGTSYNLVDYIAEKLGAVAFDDYAVGGQGIRCDNDSPFPVHIMNQLKTAQSKGMYDIYIIMGGVNDYWCNEVPLGDSAGSVSGSSDNEEQNISYCGGLLKAIDYIRVNAPNAKIYTITPFKGYNENWGWNPRTKTRNANGNTFYEFVQAQKEVAQVKGIPCLDLWAMQGFSGANASEHYISDLLHPNGNGYYKVSEKLVEFIAHGVGSEVVDVQALMFPTNEKNAIALEQEINRAKDAEQALSERIDNIPAGGGGVTEDEFNALSKEVNGNSEAVALYNRTIINYNSRYGIPDAVTKQQVINDLLNKHTTDKGTIVTYYAEDGWHTIQYKLNYYSQTEGVKDSNWEEIGGGDYTLPIATPDTLGGVKSATNRPINKAEDDYFKCDVYIKEDGVGYVPIEYATTEKAGVMSAGDKTFIDSIAQSEEVDDINDAVLLVVGKSDGTFVRVSPSVLRGVTTQYLTKSDYDNLVALGGIKDNVEYNIIENE